MVTDYPATPDLRVLATLKRIAASHQQMWCFPNLATIGDMLKNVYQRRMSVRTLVRHLGALQRDGYIERRRRHKRGAHGELELHSTVYVIKKRAVRVATAFIAIGIIAGTHHWSKRWLSAVPKPAISAPHQGDLEAAGRNRAPPADPLRAIRLRRIVETALKRIPLA